MVDTADIAFTTVTFGGSEEIYEWVSGKEVGSLTERNIMAKGVADRATSALNYAGDVLTGNKSAREIGTDVLETAWSGAKGVYSDVIEPFVKDGQYMLEDTQGGRWTRSSEESYEKGRNRGKQDLVIAELVVSRGAFSAYKQAAKQTIDIGPDGDSQRGKRDGGNGTGLLLDGADNNRNSSSSLKGGKLKTQAKSFPKSIEELQKEVEKLLKQMGNMLGGVAVFRDAYSGEYRFYFVRHDDLSGGNGGGGGNHRRSDNGDEGTGEANKPNLYDKDGNYTGGRSQKELDDLATDPDRGYVLDEQGEKEREVGLAVEERGELGKIKRDSGGAEFYDESSPTKQRWDVKSYESYPNGHTNPKKGAFSVKRTLENMYKKLNKDINIIIDTRGLIPEHVAQLKDAVSKEGIADRIIWYP
ncbi:hypothetical protein [Brevibacillus sp. DP1.3A]|uniref:hypothetical protein n=1 Tax=Brevibacillus sp. DP1.3A TaxID=2738867 RepID=UPI00156ADD53|nr:hypothetical protein [Brevibacillus sp. DP1.3A]MED1919411.1 hypothetical protein [Bacillus thuringiensis]UED73883.1 hypothetical protein HP399_024620 [Brevibacillus sp. DP1.3A]